MEINLDQQGMQHKGIKHHLSLSGFDSRKEGLLFFFGLIQ